MISQTLPQTPKCPLHKAAWHLITCEYPPQIGGLSDYTFLIARELAKTGEEVHVWCPRTDGQPPEAPGVALHQELGRFSLRDLRRTGKLMDSFPRPRCLFVQWVPHGYGYRSMNIFFCLWLWMRAKIQGDEVQIMFHEVWLAFGRGWKRNIAATVHRMMIMLLKKSAARIWIAGEIWREHLRGARAPIRWLPIPSNVPFDPCPTQVAAIRKRLGTATTRLVGYFGIGDHYVYKLLLSFILQLMKDRPDIVFLLIGKSSHKLAREICHACPQIRTRISSTGVIRSDEIAEHISACDLLIQPYVDGVSTRRGGALAVLANGIPLLTTSGHSTEPFWFSCRGVAMAPSGDQNALVTKAKQLLNDDEERTRMAVAGRGLYRTLFDISISVGVLQANTPVP